MLKNIAVIGAGTMGSGIAQVAATAGCSVQLFDAFPEALKKAQNSLEITLSKLLEKGKISEEEKNRILGNIRFESELNSLSGAELIIEAIIENLEIKRKLFSELEQIVSLLKTRCFGYYL